MKIRLDKFLADMSEGSRKEVKQIIKKGEITVDGEIVKDESVKIDIDQQMICRNGREIAYRKWEFYMLNKPAGYVTAVTDHRDKTVMELLESKRKDLFPVGRLDKDTEGLLLITNCGELAHTLLAPEKHVDKKYFVRIDGALTEEMKRRLEEGVFIEKGLCTRLAKLEAAAEENSQNEWYLTIHEGRFHQVKKMFAAVGRNVIYLKRVEFGPLRLDPALPPGKARELSGQEIAGLEQCTGLHL